MREGACVTSTSATRDGSGDSRHAPSFLGGVPILATFSQLKRACAVPPVGVVICTTALALPGTDAGAVPVS